MQINKKILVPILLILFVLSISAISAIELDDVNNSNFVNVDNDIENDQIVESRVDQSLDENNKISLIDDSQNVSTPVNNEQEVKSGQVIQIDPSNYSDYFDKDGNIISGISQGDILDLSGVFVGKKFIINMPLTVTS